MDRQYIREHAVIERYLAGALSADEEQAFEEAYLGDAAILEELQAAERLREGIAELDGAGRVRRSRPQPGGGWLASPRYAAAATVLLAVSLGFSTLMYRENRALREEGLAMTSAVTRFVPLESVRGTSAVTIREPEDDEWTVLLLDAGLTEYDSYRATLTRGLAEQSEEIWSRADLTPQLEGRVSIGIPGSILRPGTYEARLEGRMNGGPPDRFEEISRAQLTVVARD
jgi:hypothetical protein